MSRNMDKSVEGPFIGPDGRKWADPAYTIPWGDTAAARKVLHDGAAGVPANAPCYIDELGYWWADPEHTVPWVNEHKPSVEEVEEILIGERVGQVEIAMDGRVLIRSLPNGHHPATRHLLQFFQAEHLPEHLRLVSEPCGALAHAMADRVPDGPEKTVGLRKLLEAKDCFVRAVLAGKGLPS